MKPADFDAVYTELRPAILRFIDRKVEDSCEAENLTQDTFLKAWRAWTEFDGQNMRAWIYTIAGNVATDYLRHRAITYRIFLPRLLEGLVSDHRNPEHCIDALDCARVLSKLSERHRQMLVHYAAGYSYEELREHYHTTMPAVKAMIYRARNALVEAEAEAEKIC